MIMRKSIRKNKRTTVNKEKRIPEIVETFFKEKSVFIKMSFGSKISFSQENP